MPELTTEPVEISVVSSEYLTIPFTSDVDPELLGTVEMAFTTGHNDPPAEEDWVTAEISGSTLRLLVGPSGTVLPAGFYLVWTRLTDVTEAPVEPIGHLRIY